MVQKTEDQCAVLYQLITPSVACNIWASRGLHPELQPLFRRLYSEWWSNSPLITPNQLSRFLFRIKMSLMENFSVNFMVRVIFCECAVWHVYHVTTFETLIMTTVWGGKLWW